MSCFVYYNLGLNVFEDLNKNDLDKDCSNFSMSLSLRVLSLYKADERLSVPVSTWPSCIDYSRKIVPWIRKLDYCNSVAYFFV